MSKRKLLLADDSITIQKVVNLTFADEGIEVITVGDGDSAMQKVSELRPDLVLADVHMPGLSGYQVCEQIRANEDTNALPVLLLVGSFEPFDESEAERVGANGFMTKPFQSIRELVSKVSELMDAAAGARDSVSGNGAVTIPGVEPTEADIAAPAGVEADSPYQEQEFDDAGDIDELYKESVGETPETEFDQAMPANHVDAGMDDEMIEARYADDAGSFDEPESVESESAYSDQAAGGSFEQEESADQTAGATEHQTGAVFDQFSETERMDPGVVEGAPAPEAGERGENHFGEAEAPTGEYQGITSATTDKFEFDDLNLLELPPVRQAETMEVTTSQDAAARGGGQQLVTLTPELLDVIVQRVIDKLSEQK